MEEAGHDERDTPKPHVYVPAWLPLGIGPTAPEGATIVQAVSAGAVVRLVGVGGPLEKDGSLLPGCRTDHEQFLAVECFVRRTIKGRWQLAPINVYWNQHRDMLPRADPIWTSERTFQGHSLAIRLDAEVRLIGGHVKIQDAAWKDAPNIRMAVRVHDLLFPSAGDVAPESHHDSLRIALASKAAFQILDALSATPTRLLHEWAVLHESCLSWTDRKARIPQWKRKYSVVCGPTKPLNVQWLRAALARAMRR